MNSEFPFALEANLSFNYGVRIFLFFVKPHFSFSLLFCFVMGSRDGAVVRELASHQCGPGSTPGPGIICGLSLVLVLFLAPRGFSAGTPVFPSSS